MNFIIAQLDALKKKEVILIVKNIRANIYINGSSIFFFFTPKSDIRFLIKFLMENTSKIFYLTINIRGCSYLEFLIQYIILGQSIVNGIFFLERTLHRIYPFSGVLDLDTCIVK